MNRPLIEWLLEEDLLNLREGLKPRPSRLEAVDETSIAPPTISIAEARRAGRRSRSPRVLLLLLLLLPASAYILLAPEIWLGPLAEPLAPIRNPLGGVRAPIAAWLGLSPDSVPADPTGAAALPVTGVPAGSAASPVTAATSVTAAADATATAAVAAASASAPTTAPTSRPVASAAPAPGPPAVPAQPPAAPAPPDRTAPMPQPAPVVAVAPVPTAPAPTTLWFVVAGPLAEAKIPPAYANNPSFAATLTSAAVRIERPERVSVEAVDVTQATAARVVVERTLHFLRLGPFAFREEASGFVERLRAELDAPAEIVSETATP